MGFLPKREAGGSCPARNCDDERVRRGVVATATGGRLFRRSCDDERGRRVVKVAVFGLGAVGARVTRQLASTDGVAEILLSGPHRERLEAVVKAVGTRVQAVHDAEAAGEVDVAVLAGPATTQQGLARALVTRGVSVVSVSDALDDVEYLLSLDDVARRAGTVVAVGAGFAPGLSCVLADHAAATLDVVDEIHVAKVGTGGPECARQHHRAFADAARELRDGSWVEYRSGSGRELCWFPDPIGARDCYRASLPDSVLLAAAFPGARRISARLSASRRDRLTGRFPMMRPPHPEGGPGALRVELRGWRAGEYRVEVLGVMDRPAVAAGAVAALAATEIASGHVMRAGSAGLSQLVEALAFLHELHRRGVRAATFEGRARHIA